MRKVLNLVAISFISVSIGFISGCNTVKGIGKDVSKGGHEIQRAAN